MVALLALAACGEEEPSARFAVARLPGRRARALRARGPGRAFTGADGTIAVLAGFDEVTVTGVGTCGPDDPARRSYHLGYLAERRGERWGGSLEFVLRDGEWSIGLVFADSFERWKSQYSNPETELACGNVQAWSRG